MLIPDPDPAKEIHRITRCYANCQACGLPTLTCICSAITPIQTQARFIVLTPAKELQRASNTGRILKLINPEATQIIHWERTRPSSELLMILQSQANVYLVFPAESASAKSRSVSRVSGPRPVFVLLDGTWQEARKIARKSAYLNELPLLTLPENLHSDYRLRTGQNAGSLCTIEAAMECLNLASEAASAGMIWQTFKLFLKHYQAGLCGHRVKAGD